MTLADTALKTRSQSQKSPYKNLKPKWPKTSHLGLRPFTLRFLSAPVRALLSESRLTAPTAMLYLLGKLNR
ncbi:hypothetical protein BVJ53_08855 [Lacticaseibacillus chiayiensis]|uniref:Uncharacterized protein n=1 Tax=Lacticaseibacillus chiayiensis TaxID=2100821 RepID=A0A4Q1TUU0_9LACO|nr:hypothetical protein BVJ53_08855 [Lacticaseibacillus chiayiensis]RXT58440.1 hypothetical protein CHT97_06430 [Lacticaseibacillus chiayiensis]